jgi:hypothetical protein
VAIDPDRPGSPWTGREIKLGSRRFASLRFGAVSVDASPILESVHAGGDKS